MQLTDGDAMIIQYPLTVSEGTLLDDSNAVGIRLNMDDMQASRD